MEHCFSLIMLSLLKIEAWHGVTWNSQAWLGLATPGQAWPNSNQNLVGSEKGPPHLATDSPKRFGHVIGCTSATRNGSRTALHCPNLHVQPHA